MAKHFKTNKEPSRQRYEGRPKERYTESGPRGETRPRERYTESSSRGRYEDSVPAERYVEIRPRAAAKKRSGAKNKVLVVLMVVFFGVFVFSGVKLFTELSDARAEEKDFENLAELRERETMRPDALMTPPPEEPKVREDGILTEYGELYDRNNDMFGWVSIDGTSIDYPVMLTPDDEQYYLRRNFEREYSNAGVPFLAAGCREGCGNYIIYGHHLMTGGMFTDLIEYKDEEFERKHPLIRFDTVHEEGEYRIFAAFEGTARSVGEEGFRYYGHTDFSDETEFREFINEVKGLSYYDTGIVPQFGDQILTLSTCMRSDVTDRERMVVCAVKEEGSQISVG